MVALAGSSSSGRATESSSPRRSTATAFLPRPCSNRGEKVAGAGGGVSVVHGPKQSPTPPSRPNRVDLVSLVWGGVLLPLVQELAMGGQAVRE